MDQLNIMLYRSVIETGESEFLCESEIGFKMHNENYENSRLKPLPQFEIIMRDR